MSDATILLFLFCMMLFVVFGGMGLGGLVRDLTWDRDWWGRVRRECVVMDIVLIATGALGGIVGWVLLP